MPDWKIIAQLTAFIVAFGAFVLFALDPAMQSREVAAQIWGGLKDWQTLIAGSLAIAAAALALYGSRVQATSAIEAANRQAASVREATEREIASIAASERARRIEETRRVAAVLRAELVNLRTTVLSELSVMDAQIEIARSFVDKQKANPDSIVEWDPRQHERAAPMFSALAAQIGALDTKTVASVVTAYERVLSISRSLGEPQRKISRSMLVRLYEQHAKGVQIAYVEVMSALDALAPEAGIAAEHLKAEKALFAKQETVAGVPSTVEAIKEQWEKKKE